MLGENLFPVHVFPLVIRNAIHEVGQHTQVILPT